MQQRERGAQAVVVRRGRGRPRADDQRDLPPRRLGDERRDLGGGAAHDLLVELGELAADRDRPAGPRLGQSAEGLGKAARALERHGRHVDAREALHQRPALGRPPRQEAQHHEPALPGQARRRQGRRDRARAGDHRHGSPGGERGAHQALARVAHEGHPGVAHQGHPVSLPSSARRARPPAPPRCGGAARPSARSSRRGAAAARCGGCPRRPPRRPRAAPRRPAGRDRPGCRSACPPPPGRPRPPSRPLPPCTCSRKSRPRRTLPSHADGPDHQALPPLSGARRGFRRGGRARQAAGAERPRVGPCLRHGVPVAHPPAPRAAQARPPGARAAPCPEARGPALVVAARGRAGDLDRPDPAGAAGGVPRVGRLRLHGP